jgi:hypothetical protein
MLLTSAEIPHLVHIGSVNILGTGSIPLHFWISLPSGVICDYRLRMWLGNSPEIPHGIFTPSDAVEYVSLQTIEVELDETLFFILTGRKLDHFSEQSSSNL